MSGSKKSFKISKTVLPNRRFVAEAVSLQNFEYFRYYLFRLFYSTSFSNISAYKTTTILLDGKRVKLQLWDTSGQGRFCTIIRSYSRGAQGILLVYDITNKWSFDSIERWLEEVDKVMIIFIYSIVTL